MKNYNFQNANMIEKCSGTVYYSTIQISIPLPLCTIYSKRTRMIKLILFSLPILLTINIVLTTGITAISSFHSEDGSKLQLSHTHEWVHVTRYQLPITNLTSWGHAEHQPWVNESLNFLKIYIRCV